jgi:polyisoprenoid-binding protein YceI
MFNTCLAAEQYTLDAAHSQMTFRVRQYVSVVTGTFTDFSGTVTFDPAHWERSHVEATISVKSIDTGIAARDHHLLALRVELQSPAKSGTETSVWTVSTHLRRSAFGLKWNPVIEATSGISDDIDIQMHMVTPAR